MGSSAFRFVLAMGIVNLFADMTYEGGSSINGPFLGALGAGAAAISILAGVGEFLGYALRSVSGYVSDRTGRYWLVTFAGYAVNLLAVPALALVGHWPLAAALVLAERIGRAMRKPTVEAMLSHAAEKHGRGWVYAVNTALDETGATLGPLLMALVLFRGGSYRSGYALLLVSALLALAALTGARLAFPAPSRLEAEGEKTASGHAFTRAYWLNTAAATCFAAGLMSYELVGYHVVKSGLIGDNWMPVLLAAATGCGVAASLLLGRLYDRVGLPVILAAVALSALCTPLLFLGGFAALLAAMPLLGIGYAVQDTLLKAVVAGLLPKGRRGLAFGLFYSGYGAGWLMGSVSAGLLYDRSRVALVLVAVAAQLASLPFFLLADRSRSLRAV